jgi:probable F420-dependent oxidoreductase
VKIGIDFPYPRVGTDPDVFRALLQEAEAQGFAYATFIDHVLGAEHARREPPLTLIYDERSAFHEPLTLAVWGSAHTERLEFVTAVLVLAQRQTALVAKQAAEVQLLSGGRLRLGVGSGWNHVEYEALGVPFAARGARLEEQVDVMRRLWREPLVDVTGRFHRLDRVSMLPTTVAPPVWFGGASRAQEERCARVGDGFIWERRLVELTHGTDADWTLGPGSELARGVAHVREHASALGRDPASIGHQLGTCTSPEDVHTVVDRWHGLGGTHLTVAVPGDGAEMVGNLAPFARALGSLLR